MSTLCTAHIPLQQPASKLTQSQKGSVMVEFAFILPVFMMLLFGVIFFSVALYNKTVLTMATREGARAGAIYVPNRDNAGITSSANAAVLQVCQNNLVDFGTGMVPAITATVSGDILTVSASGNYTGLYIFPGLSISAQTSMRLE